MALPVWAVGQVLSAADVNNWLVPMAVVKPSDTARNTTTTPTNDPDLVLAVAANANYDVSGVIYYTGAASSADIKFLFNVPGSATGQYYPARQNTSGTFVGAFAAQWTDTLPANTTGTSPTANLMAVNIKGILLTTSAGNFQFQWAQNTSSGTNTTVRANSYLIAQRIG